MDSNKKRIDTLFSEAFEIIRNTSDEDIPRLIGDGVLDKLLKAILVPKKAGEQTIYEYLLKNKHRLQLLALMRLAIHNNYSIKGKVSQLDVYVSPWHIQWYETGVMFLQGHEQFAGLLGLYEAGRVKFGIIKRDIRGGEKIDKEAVDFVDVDEMEKRHKQPSVPSNTEALNSAVEQLQILLHQGKNDESLYQDYLAKNPWVIGAQYQRIDSHKIFDDENIPDFTAIRVRDSARDIIEIKPPFLSIFTKKKPFQS